MSQTKVNLAVLGGSAAILAAAMGGVARADGYLGSGGASADPTPAASLPVEQASSRGPAEVSFHIELGQLAPADPIRLATLPPLAVPRPTRLDVSPHVAPSSSTSVARPGAAPQPVALSVTAPAPVALVAPPPPPAPPAPAPARKTRAS